MQIKSPQWQEMLRLQSANLDIALEDEDIARLGEFIAELITWNKKTNLTAITVPSEVVEMHIIDSLIPAKFIPGNATVIDLGTGSGFPGIPLKICKPSLSVSLVDSSRKKNQFFKICDQDFEA